MSNRKQGQTQEQASAKAGVSERSARRIEGGRISVSEHKERHWRTRKDPFAEIWDSEVEAFADFLGATDDRNAIFVAHILFHRRWRGKNAGATLAERLRQGAVIELSDHERINLVPLESDNPDMELVLLALSIGARYSMLDLGPCRVTGAAGFFRMRMFSISTPMEKAMAK